MYRSLHTTLLAPNGIPFEVQIRTKEMHRTAEYGIAAHWMYKEGRTVQSLLDKKTSWLRQVIEAKENTEDSREFVESIMKDFLGEYVFVLTPRGEIIDLPVGSTPLDFATASIQTSAITVRARRSTALWCGSTTSLKRTTSSKS